MAAVGRLRNAACCRVLLDDVFGVEEPKRSLSLPGGLKEGAMPKDLNESAMLPGSMLCTTLSS